VRLARSSLVSSRETYVRAVYAALG
jgi:hypothetical protein